MTQGFSKLKKKNTKKTKNKRKNVSKGWKHVTPKGPKTALSKMIQSTSKAINKKNEQIICGRALSNGTKFFLNDMNEKGIKNKAEFERMKKKKKKRDAKSFELT